MKLAIAQTGSIPGDFAFNVEHMLGIARRAATRSVDLLLFPTTVLSGAYPTGLVENRAYVLALLDAVRAFAHDTPVLAAVPAYLQDAEGCYTEVFLCGDGAAVPLRRREAARPDLSAAGPAGATAKAVVRGSSVSFLTNDTPTAPEDLVSDVAVVYAPVPYAYDDPSTLGVYGLGEGIVTGGVGGDATSVVVVQGVGGYDDVVLAGGSYAVDVFGNVAAAGPLFEEDLVTFDTENPAPAAGEVRCPFTGLALDEVPLVADDERVGYLYRALTLAVRDYVRKSGFSDVVVGLSGGIDSSVVAALAADALGAEHVLGVLMPGPFSSESSVADALDLAARLDVATRTVPIGGLYEAACPLLSDALQGPFEGVARENLQARLRGTVLMSLANATGALVLNTGNKSESGMGYSTLYGDTVGAFAPLCDVYKGHVRALARWRNAHGPHPVIPANVLAKPPSAELSEGQTDEASFGASYDLIDQVLSLHVERGLTAQEIVDAGFGATVVNKVLSSCANAEFKRRQEPLGPVVTMRPFVDRGWPVVMAWRDRAADDPSGEDAVSPLNDVEVDDVLNDMLYNGAHSEQAIGFLGDVAFGNALAGSGADMDPCLGMPLFSKN
jgi:NAD+ synthetase